ncbi:hypothetical protein [Pseudomonas entomophila]|uniref:Uncharacterized protein n=2 Tax=Pseudomonas entomophila TaxID=312306 RepID=Q1I516_PSEE4|nr:hypothetical protein [Pseudomonas entomophila]WMW07016.1 hypothetical protein RAH46_06680 [Pseudomonas entomophila]CAK17270.1 hypothetical protein PSEEN4592 [Pseudomonas entomophila L48]
MNNAAEINIALNHGEASALKKALLYLKFECEETSSLIFSGSPLVNSVLDKLIDQSVFGSSERQFFDNGNKAAEKFMLEKLIRTLEADDNQGLSEDRRSAYFKECMRPYKID